MNCEREEQKNLERKRDKTLNFPTKSHQQTNTPKPQRIRFRTKQSKWEGSQEEKNQKKGAIAVESRKAKEEMSIRAPHRQKDGKAHGTKKEKSKGTRTKSSNHIVRHKKTKKPTAHKQNKGKRKAKPSHHCTMHNKLSLDEQWPVAFL